MHAGDGATRQWISNWCGTVQEAATKAATADEQAMMKAAKPENIIGAETLKRVGVRLA